MEELKLETEWITLFKGILILMSYTGWNAGKAMEALNVDSWERALYEASVEAVLEDCEGISPVMGRILTVFEG